MRCLSSSSRNRILTSNISKALKQSLTLQTLETTELNKYVTNFLSVSDRIILFHLNTETLKPNILQIYAPTANKKNDDQVENSMKKICDILQKFKKHEITYRYIRGEFNAKVYKRSSKSQAVGSHGLGQTNEREERLHEFWKENEMVVTNTWYKLSKRRLHTWKVQFDDGTNPEKMPSKRVTFP